MARPVGRRGETRERALQAALELFAQHGVSGTSLQMIADRLGLTKAAVYHQFATKDEIVLAVLQPAVDLISVFVEEAEAEPTRAGQVDVALRGLVAVVIEHRLVVTVLNGDPAVTAVTEAHPTIQSLTPRMTALLGGSHPDAATRVAVSMTAAGLFASGANPRLADLDDDVLRVELLACARRLLGQVSQ